MSEEIRKLLSSISKMIIRLIPYMTLLSGLIIWSYLNSIGRVDILSDAFSLNASLISVLISAVIFSLAISITLLLPSSILIIYRTIYEKNITSEQIISKAPSLCLFLSIIFLLFIYVPFIPEVEKIIKNYKPRMSYISLLIASIAFAFIFLSSLIYFEKNRSKGIVKNIICFTWSVLKNTLLITGVTLSVSIPITLLMQSSKGEDGLAIIFALFFMITFVFFTFFPAMVHYNNINKSKKENNIIAIIQQISLTVVYAIFSIFLFFPNLSTMFIYTSLSTIGMVSKNSHFYLINGEKYKPAMFHKESWDTQTPPNIGESFYIKGVNIFSVENKNLICPDYIVKIKNDAYERDYASFVPLNDEKKIAHLKQMTRDCIVLEDSDAQQWDTLFDDKGKIKE